MGNASYSSETRNLRATTRGYHTKSRQEIFTQRTIDPDMDPKNLSFRESRDSEANPQSVPVILGLDVTGSMGSVPHMLIKDGLPTIMSTIMQGGCPDPALLFLAIGDHECDSSPLQVAQFESGDEELDQWLEKVYLEGGGGGNAGESYMLAWMFAAYHTVTDHWEKRGQKGFLFTVGDEPVLRELPSKALTDIMGGTQLSNQSSAELLDKAREKWNVYHLHIKQTPTGRRQGTIDGWKELLGDNLIIVEGHEDLPGIIARIVAENVDYEVKPAAGTQQTSSKEEDQQNDDEPEILL